MSRMSSILKDADWRSKILTVHAIKITSDTVVFRVSFEPHLHRSPEMVRLSRFNTDDADNGRKRRKIGIGNLVNPIDFTDDILRASSKYLKDGLKNIVLGMTREWCRTTISGMMKCGLW